MPAPTSAQKSKAPLYLGLAVLALALATTLWLGIRTQDSSLEARGPLLNQNTDKPWQTHPPELEENPPIKEQATEQPALSIENERVLSFANDADYQRFLQRKHGAYKILAQNATLRAARIQLPEGVLDGSLPDSAHTDFNYTLLTPLPVDAATAALDKAFGGSALDFMGVPHARAEAGKGVKIAILDTGIRDHTTLDKNAIERYGSDDPSNYRSHGTAVASLIAGQDGTGIAPASKLISIQVLDTDGIGDTFSLAEGIVRAVDAGANIINMSLGSYGSNAPLANAIEYASSHGVVLVASAGNEAVTALPYPAAYESVIAVSAIDAEGHPTSFSNQSASVDIAAPGVGVYAAWEDDKWISFTGTSAAAPYVSGAIAALSSERGIPAAEAASILLSNANDSGLPGNDPQLGRGYIDLQRSIDSDKNYADLALADIYLDPTVNKNGQYTVYITAQNRGTQTIPTAQISYTLANGITQNAYLGSLDPGEVATRILHPTEIEIESTSGYTVEAVASSTYRSNDSVPQNDSRSATLIKGSKSPTSSP